MVNSYPKIALFMTMGLLSGVVIQAQSLTVPADGGNKQASVSERIGLTDITITYDRPNALKFAKAAQPQAPDKVNRDNVDRVIAQLGEGKDINQP